MRAYPVVQMRSSAYRAQFLTRCTNMVKIDQVKARQVFHSRGIPTVEAEIFLSGGGFGRFITPSGASVGKKEALELRDNVKSQFMGRGVLRAIANIKNDIANRV